MNEEQIKDLKEHVRARGLTQESLAELFGVSQANISALLNGKTPFGKGVAASWEEKLGIRAAWLMIGDGKMLKSGSVVQSGSRNIQISGSHNKNIGTVRRGGNYEVSGEQKNGAGEVTGVPYYDVDFIGGMDAVNNDQTINPTYYIHFPQYAKAESWVNVTGHSMEPLINHGDMIAMKRLEDWNTYLLYGEVYAIVTDEYRTIKYVRKSARGEDYLRLIPANSDFDEQDIPKSVVRGVFQILGCAKRIF